MAARKKRIVHDENTRAKIQASQIINRLTKHIVGEIEMSSTQVTAALGLLKKSLPDLASVEMKAEVEQINYVINSEAVSENEWEREYSDSLGASTGATESTH